MSNTNVPACSQVPKRHTGNSNVHAKARQSSRLFTSKSTSDRKSKNTTSTQSPPPPFTSRNSHSSSRRKDNKMTLITEDAMAPAVDELRRLYIENVPYKAAMEDLRKFFGAYDIEGIILPRNKHGKSMGCAFVDVSTSREAERAVRKLDQQYLFDRKVTISIAQPPPKSRTSSINESGSKSSQVTSPLPSPLIAQYTSPKREKWRFDDVPPRDNGNDALENARMLLISRTKDSEDYFCDPRFSDEEKNELFKVAQQVYKNQYIHVLTDTEASPKASRRYNKGDMKIEELFDSPKHSDVVTEMARIDKEPSTSVLNQVDHDRKAREEFIGSIQRTLSVSGSSPQSPKSDSSKESFHLRPAGEDEGEMADLVLAYNRSRAEIERLREEMEKINLQKRMDVEAEEREEALAKQKAVVATKDGVKTHCTFFLRTGYCDFMQQGCKYSHELPPGGIAELRSQAGLPPLGLGSVPKGQFGSPVSTPAFPFGSGGQRNGIRHPDLDFSRPSQQVPMLRQLIERNNCLSRNFTPARNNAVDNWMQSAQNPRVSSPAGIAKLSHTFQPAMRADKPHSQGMMSSRHAYSFASPGRLSPTIMTSSSVSQFGGSRFTHRQPDGGELDETASLFDGTSVVTAPLVSDLTSLAPTRRQSTNTYVSNSC